MIIEFIKNAGADSEEASDRNGFLSWSGEWHAFGMGVARGSQDPYHLISPLPDGDTEHEIDSRREKGYYYLGCFVGTAIQLGLLGLSYLVGKEIVLSSILG